MSKIYVFGGGKGGVGKTTAALSFILSQKEAGRAMACREGDATNPDVARALGLGEEALFNPSEINDWSNILEQAKSGDVVVNLPGGGDKAFLENAAAIAEAAGADGNQVVFVSTLNRSRECVFLLNENLELLAGSGVTPAVVVNEFFGEVAKFTRFNNSKTRKKLAEAGGVEIVLADLNETAFDMMISPAGKELETAPPLIRSIFKSWLAKAGKAFTGI